MAVKMHVKKNDTVKILSGKDRGKTGKVLQVLPAERRVVVEGINIIRRHTRPSRENPQGGVVERPAPLAASKVMVICPSCNEPTRVGWSRGEEGAARVCAKCGKTMD
ncbi:MAG: 50S ribosomal protein L24 [Firmicutes bacterium]|nr:50S ribosomal protein L24 [Bacillota bacterium]